MKTDTQKQQILLVFVTICYGLIAVLYDLKLGVVYCGTLVVGATALDLVRRKLKEQQNEIENLRLEMDRLKKSIDAEKGHNQ
ncbi:hypothetical protein [Rubritalea marina]|uniref:hypothetical protein n=1 Tax=Rubritalea marina TaxID=361055 RepID=UPI0003802418|nr:hypothetical protein [Rubritalea marina]